MRKITKLEAAKQTVQRKRVAAYARVSSGKDAMLHSLSAQISYYNSYIGSRGDWQLVGIYADEALTGTKEDRLEFQHMLADCREGKIDMIITKSLTRFARNTVTLLETVRELRLLGVDVYFEKESIHTLSADGELMLTLLASFAQEESRSVSENMKWRIRKMFEQGRPNTGRMLGYRLVDGALQIIPEEAEVVKMIFSDYLSGMGKNAIVKKLIRLKIPPLRSAEWQESTVYRILRNEKYTGNMLLQKTYHLDHISKKRMINHGELAQYYVENSHEPIIDKDTFNRVQREIDRRAEKSGLLHKQPTAFPFTGILRCGICGKFYRRRITHAGSKYMKAAWICPTFVNRGKSACPSRQIPEDILVRKTGEMLQAAEFDRDTLLARVTEIIVSAPNQLTYVFKDGRTEVAAWQNQSRRDSWTEEMKQAARERAAENAKRRRKNGNA
jgi:site-specific DNA recombinase